MKDLQNMQDMQNMQNMQTCLTNLTKPKLLVKAVNAWVRNAFGNVSIICQTKMKVP